MALLKATHGAPPMLRHGRKRSGATDDAVTHAPVAEDAARVALDRDDQAIDGLLYGDADVFAVGPAAIRYHQDVTRLYGIKIDPPRGAQMVVDAQGRCHALKPQGMADPRRPRAERRKGAAPGELLVFGVRRQPCPSQAERASNISIDALGVGNR